MLSSLRFALRINGKHPFSSLIIVLAIAVLVAIAGVFYATLEQQRVNRLPFEEPGRILKLWRAEKSGPSDTFDDAVFREFADRQHAFAAFGAVGDAGKKLLTSGEEPVSLHVFVCSAAVLEITGLSPVIGRFLAEPDERLQDGPVVVLSEEIWRERFDASDSVIGRVLLLDEEPYTVVGVAPHAMTHTRLAYGADAWVPLPDKVAEKRPHTVRMVGRLKAGKTRDQAEDEVQALLARIDASGAGGDPQAVAGRGFVAGLDEQVRSRDANWREVAAMTAMAALLGCVALIACCNMMALLFVRNAARIGELTVRLSQGASRGRIMRQLLGESLVLSLAGGALGLPLSLALLRLASVNAVGFVFDPVLYMVAFGLAVLLGGLVSIWPAVRASGADLTGGMKDFGGVSMGRRRHRTRNCLVGAQIGMAAILIGTATLIVRGFWGIQSGELPVDAKQLVTVEIRPDQERFQTGIDRSNYANRALRAVRELPGVASAAVTSTDLSANFAVLQGITVRGSGDVAGKEASVMFHQISSDLPSLLGRQLLVGSGLNTDGPPALEALVNRTFVERYLDGVEPLGQRFQCSMVVDGDFTIVGVVSDSHVRMSPSRIRPEVFVSYRHPLPAWASVNLLVEATSPPAHFAPLLRQTLLSLDPQQPVGRAITIDSIIHSWMEPMLEFTVAIVCLAAFGLTMALLGIYGVVAYAAVERTQEMGIRMALGAGRDAVLRLIIGEGARLLMIGALPGILLAVLVAQGLPSGMFRTVSALDPATYLLGLGLIAITGLVASLLPACQMLKLKPMDALRLDV